MYPQLFTKTLFETLNMMSALHSLDNVHLCWYVISTQAYLLNPIHTSQHVLLHNILHPVSYDMFSRFVTCIFWVEIMTY